MYRIQKDLSLLLLTKYGGNFLTDVNGWQMQFKRFHIKYLKQHTSSLGEHT